ncbi:hypothetical protein VMCG_07332 [Cytospora schulzeri]|uniref:Signal peptidase complex catalytic subunit SEC11 n=1 Tax=Cytospora schulzeri TaxID=448051 RepID=A0A423WAK1_9PEZI|nr:hypothetical protein VMCG_07332 [Valsa malicola]
MPLSAAFMAWKGLCVLTNSPVPIVCVISESMAPAFHRGDVLLLWNRKPTIEAGDIPVIWFEGNPLPMVHRVVQVFIDGSKQQFLTKGDNNNVDDVALYPGNRTLVTRNEVAGFVRGYIPYLGWLVLGFQNLHWMKYGCVLLAASFIFAGA